MAWDECDSAVGRREDCVTVTHLSAGVGRGAVSGLHISRPRIESAPGGFLMTPGISTMVLAAGALFRLVGSICLTHRAGCTGVRCLHLAGSNSRDETVQSSATRLFGRGSCAMVGLSKVILSRWVSWICTGYDRCTPISHHTLTSTCMTPVDVV